MITLCRRCFKVLEHALTDMQWIFEVENLEILESVEAQPLDMREHDARS